MIFFSSIPHRKVDFSIFFTIVLIFNNFIINYFFSAGGPCEGGTV